MSNKSEELTAGVAYLDLAMKIKINFQVKRPELDINDGIIADLIESIAEESEKHIKDEMQYYRMWNQVRPDGHYSLHNPTL